MSELRPGTFVVAVVEHGIIKSNEKPVAKLTFSNGATWFGSFTGGAAEWTTKSLVNAGFFGTKIEQLNIDGAIDPSHKCQIVMDNEEYEGKVRLKVKFINRLADKMNDKELATTLGGMNIDAQLAEARNSMGLKGVTVSKKSPLQQGADQSFTADDIPF